MAPAIDEKSCSVEMIFVLAIAGATAVNMSSESSVTIRFMESLSEWMSAVGADGELDLQEELVGHLAVGEVAAPELAAQLGELAGPEGEQRRRAAVVHRLVVRVLGVLVARPREPPLGELVLPGEEPPGGELVARWILEVAADELSAQIG